MYLSITSLLSPYHLSVISFDLCIDLSIIYHISKMYLILIYYLLFIYLSIISLLHKGNLLLQLTGHRDLITGLDFRPIPSPTPTGMHVLQCLLYYIGFIIMIIFTCILYRSSPSLLLIFSSKY